MTEREAFDLATGKIGTDLNLIPTPLLVEASTLLIKLAQGLLDRVEYRRVHRLDG